MLTAASIIERALYDAKAPLYTDAALDKLNDILDDLCETYGFAAARATYNFDFNPGLQSDFGSGPYYLPLDYLRTCDSAGSTGTQHSVWWSLLGVPYPLIPVDLAEFDMQVQQAGLQSYPWLFATDVSTNNVVLSTTVSLTTGVTTGTLAAVGNTATSGSISGQGIAPGTTYTRSSTAITLSLAATATYTAASVMLGTPTQAFVYPPPTGAYPVTVRYQRRMPPITDTSTVPWFPNQNYLLVRLAGEMMRTTDDARSAEFLGRGDSGAQGILERYLKLKDDNTNRADQIVFDRRSFGPSYSRLRNTKTIGW